MADAQPPLDSSHYHRRVTVAQGRDWPLAVAVYEQALEADELAEALSQGLMRGYLALGRPGDVAREYQRCCASLQAALGVAPAAKTRALYEQARQARQSA